MPRSIRFERNRESHRNMDAWMYIVIVGMFVLAAVGTVWITLWTIKRTGGYRRPEPPDQTRKPE